MTQTTLVVSLLLFALIVAMSIYSWINYQDIMSRAARYQRVDKPWFTRLRWVWAGAVGFLALVGYFTVVMRMSGMTLQPIVLNKPVDWPDPDEMKAISTEWHHPTLLETYQDGEVYHIRFVHPYYRDRTCCPHKLDSISYMFYDSTTGWYHGPSKVDTIK